MQEKDTKSKGLADLMRKEAAGYGMYNTARASKKFLPSLIESIKGSYKTLAGMGKGAGRGGDLGTADLIRISLPLLGVGAAAAGASAAKEKIESAAASRKVLEEIKTDPEIARAEEERANALYNTLRQYAPSVAKDPLVSQAFVKGMLQYGHVDHTVVKDLMTAERIHKELKSNPFTSLQAIKNVSWLA